MASVDKQKKSPLLFFFVSFLIVIILMFITNIKSILVDEIQLPFNNGITNLLSHNNLLAAVSFDKKIYYLDWDNLSKKPQIGNVKSTQAILLDDDSVLSLQEKPPAVIITNLKGDKKLKEISLSSNKEPLYLAVNTQTKISAVLLAETIAQQPPVIYYELMQLDFDADKTSLIVNEKLAAGKISAMAISDNGQLVALVGEKDKLGWLTLIDLKLKQKLWEKTLSETTPFLSVAFSPEDKSIYTGGSDSTLYKLNDSGEILQKLRPPSAKKQSKAPVQNIDISRDGKLIAANFGDPVNVWDCESGKNIFSRHPGHKITGGVAFSPDGRLLATSDVRQGGTIKVWNIRRR